MNSIQRLIELFQRFPGIGPRQAKRFVYFLLSQQNSYLQEIVRELENLKRESVICTSCFRFFPKNASGVNLCSICANPERDHTKLMLISHDADLDNIERTKIYTGLYFVLGGSIPVMDKEPEKRIRRNELIDIVTKRIPEKLSEIILAMNANVEGENTVEYLELQLRAAAEKNSIKISHLGRGLSTGSELEYSDEDTIANALKNRT